MCLDDSAMLGLDSTTTSFAGDASTRRGIVVAKCRYTVLPVKGKCMDIARSEGFVLVGVGRWLGGDGPEGRGS